MSNPMKIFLLSALLSSLSLTGQQREYIIVGQEVDSYPFSVNPDAGELAVEIRATFSFGIQKAKPSTSYWGIAWNHVADGYDYVILRLKNTDFGALNDRRVGELEYGRHTPHGDSVIVKGTVDKGCDLGGGANTVAVEWVGGRLRAFAGGKMLQSAIDVYAVKPECDDFCVISSGKLGLETVIIEDSEDMTRQLVTRYDADELDRRLVGSSEPLEGRWVYLDRVTDDNRARPGGYYSLMIVKEDEGYRLLYHSGANVNRSNWKPMMTKGYLRPTPFVGHYDLLWYDAMMEEVADECSASLDAEGILTLSFPLHRSSMRFYKSK